MKNNIPKIIFSLLTVVLLALAQSSVFAQTTTPEDSTPEDSTTEATTTDILTTPTPITTPETIHVPTTEELMKSLEPILTNQLYSFSVEFSPQNPGANTQVSAQVISYAFDVNRSNISWFINGKKAGTGKQFSFTTGGLGSSLSLVVSIVAPDGKQLSKEFTFQSAEVDILWETAGYAPAPYRGKVLAVSQSLIKLVAIPHGINTAASNLVYNWKRNGKNLVSASGFGKRTLSFYSAEAGNEIIELSVSTLSGKTVAQNSIIIPISRPKILFYEENPLEGPQYQKELGNDFNLGKSELILRAEPYFFSKRALSIIPWEWQMNDKKITASQKPNILYLRVPEGATQGKSLIKLSLSNILNVLETAEKALQIDFNTQ